MSDERTILVATLDDPNKFGGTTVFLVRLLTFLKQKGWKIILAVLLDQKNKLGEASRECIAAGIVVLHQESRTVKDDVNWLLSVAITHKPSILLAYENQVACYAAMVLKKQLGVNTVRVGHTDDAAEARMTQAFCRLQDDCAFSLLIAVSKSLKEKYAAVASKNTIVERIPYGAPDPGLRAQWDDDSFNIIYVGRLIQFQKRIKEVTDALVTACQRSKRIRVVLVGDGPERDYVDNAIASSGVERQINVMGRLHANAVAEACSKCHAIVLLSDFEGIPVAIMEALAIGVVPVLLHSDSGIPELVQHGKNGFICYDREEGFQKCIKELSDDASLWNRLSSAAREHYEANYLQENSLIRWHQALSMLENKKINWTSLPLAVSFPKNQWKYGLGDSSIAYGFAKLPYIANSVFWTIWKSIPESWRKIVKRLLGGNCAYINK